MDERMDRRVLTEMTNERLTLNCYRMNFFVIFEILYQLPNPFVGAFRHVKIKELVDSKKESRFVPKSIRT